MGDSKWGHHRKASKKHKQKLINDHRREQNDDGPRKGKKNG